MKKILYVANWKANPKTLLEAKKEIAIIKKQKPKNADLVICPPTAFLYPLAKEGLSLGAQDVSIFKDGSHTGEITVSMLKSIGAKFCIVGHSERRSRGESSSDIALKIKLLLSAKIIPIVCIGEHARGGDGEHFNEIRSMLTASLDGLNKKEKKQVIVAYEPIWAISTEHNGAIDASALEETVIFIKKLLKDMTEEKTVSNKVLYGGSVDQKNVKEFSLTPVDGFLIGKMSIKANTFLKIINTKV